MRDFRELSPQLRVLRLLGLLLPVVGVLLLWGTVGPVLPLIPRWPVDSVRAWGIMLDLGVLGGTCTFVANMSVLRLRRPGKVAPPLDSWQRQMRWLLTLAVLPLCGLAVVIFTPVTPQLTLWLVIPLTALVVLAYVATWIYAARKWLS